MSFEGTYKIAECAVKIVSVFEDVHRLCADYRFGGGADFCVETALKDIEFEREKSAVESRKEGLPVIGFPDGYLETLAVYRKISDQMICRERLLFHGSAVAVDGECYLFTAKSGTGKSTHTRLWRELFGSRAVMVNDDKPLLKVTESKTCVFGTPWDGKHHLSQNISAPLKAICILERGTENRIEKISRAEAYPMLLQQTYRPSDAAALEKTLVLLDRLSQNTALYRLACNMDISAAKIAYSAMKGQ
jgi:hypothetical protein